MSRFLPHTPYAEDQPLSRSILTGHVVARTITASTLVAAAIAATRQAVPRLRPKTGPAPLSSSAVAAVVVRAASTGTLVALGLGLAMTAGRMRGREDIEWRDRSWRLLENRGQVETDDWTAGGMVLGAVWGGVQGRGMGIGGWRGAVGGLGLGSVAGMVGYLGWRYGVKGGEFPEMGEEKV